MMWRADFKEVENFFSRIRLQVPLFTFSSFGYNGNCLHQPSVCFSDLPLNYDLSRDLLYTPPPLFYLSFQSHTLVSVPRSLASETILAGGRGVRLSFFDSSPPPQGFTFLVPPSLWANFSSARSSWAQQIRTSLCYVPCVPPYSSPPVSCPGLSLVVTNE